MDARTPILSAHRAQALRPFEVRAERPLKLVFSVERRRHRLDFTFVLSARLPIDLEHLVVPELKEVATRERRDELWKGTCFEVFLGNKDQRGYLEVNLAPSGDWNMYVFDDYRSGMRAALDPHPPLLKFERPPGGDTLIWHGSLRTLESHNAELSAVLASNGLVLSATAVLEYISGEREHWAIAHAGQKADFHLRDSFRLSL